MRGCRCMSASGRRRARSTSAAQRSSLLPRRSCTGRAGTGRTADVTRRGTAAEPARCTVVCVQLRMTCAHICTSAQRPRCDCTDDNPNRICAVKPSACFREDYGRAKFTVGGELTDARFSGAYSDASESKPRSSKQYKRSPSSQMSRGTSYSRSRSSTPMSINSTVARMQVELGCGTHARQRQN